MAAIKGISISPGIALGPVHVVRAHPGAVPVWSIRGEDVTGEVERLHSALAAAEADLERQQKIVLDATGEKDAGIFAVHRMVLQDPSALEQVERTIRDERINAEGAVETLIRRLKDKLGALEGASVRQYAGDMSDPWQLVLDLLLRREHESLGAAGDSFVLAAAELTPQVVTLLGRERILAIIAETGGRYSHGAVLARSFGIPCVASLPNLLARLEQGLQVIVNGDQGHVELRPNQGAVDAFLEHRQRRAARKRALSIHAGEPALTPDGHLVSVEVNMESIRDLGSFEVDHCDGTGLLRTEFLYMERSQFPSEEEQFRLYRRVLDAMGQKPVTIRTLDIGGDKQLPYFETPSEPNPALGWRGLRLTLEWSDLLIVQLRALLRASAHGNVRLLLPMVTSLDEVQAVHKIFDRIRAQLLDQGYEIADHVPVGAMIEVPSSVWIMDQLAPELDFVSVGTNDLTQYVLAVDRDNPRVSRLYEPFHPAVLRALEHVARTAKEVGITCSVCGDVAGDYAMGLVLVGMGYDSLSLAPNFLAEVRFAVRQTSFEDARELARRALAATSPDDVRAVLDSARTRLHVGLEDGLQELPPACQ